MVKAKNGNDIYLVCNIDESPEELSLRHRDLQRIVIGPYSIQLTTSGNTTKIEEQYTGSFDFGGTTPSNSSPQFSYASDASEYQLFGNKGEPTNITTTSLAYNLNVSGPTNFILAVALQDSAHMQGEAKTTNGTLYKLAAPTVTDAIKNAIIQSSSVSEQNEIFIGINGSNQGQLTVDALDTVYAYQSYVSDPNEIPIDGLKNIITVKTKLAKATAYGESPTYDTPSESSNTASKTLNVSEENLYHLQVQAQASGYLDSDWVNYYVTMQKTVYVVPNGTGTKGFINDALKLSNMVNIRAKAIADGGYDPTIVLDGEFIGNTSFSFSDMNSSKPILITSKNRTNKAKIKVPISVLGTKITIDSVDFNFTDGDYPNQWGVITLVQAAKLTLSGSTTVTASFSRVRKNCGVYLAKDNTLTIKDNVMITDFIECGVHVKDQSIFTMTGGTIEKCNTAIYVGDGCSLNLSGNAYIPYDNNKNYIDIQKVDANVVVDKLSKHSKNNQIAIKWKDEGVTASYSDHGTTIFPDNQTPTHEIAEMFNPLDSYCKVVVADGQYKLAMDYTKVTKRDIVAVMENDQLDVILSTNYMDGWDEVCTAPQVLRAFLKTTDGSCVALEGYIENTTCHIYYKRFSVSNRNEEVEHRELNITDDYTDGSICSTDVSIDDDDLGDISLIVKDRGDSWMIGITGHENEPQCSYYIFTSL